MTVYTIGHSTRPIATFVDLLRAHGVEWLVDVRTIAKSRHNPQFNEPALRRSLAAAGIGYERLTGLGGLRRTTQASVNTAWRNASFRGYADYMQTPAFDEALRQLMARARERQAAIMCAEAVPWRCHRSLIADALMVRGVRCVDIVGEGRDRVHSLTPFAKVEGERVTYPASE